MRSQKDISEIWKIISFALFADTDENSFNLFMITPLAILISSGKTKYQPLPDTSPNSRGTGPNPRGGSHTDLNHSPDSGEADRTHVVVWANWCFTETHRV